jgi:hypothetical protein
MTRVKPLLSLCIASAILLVGAAPAAAATFTVNDAGDLPDLAVDGTCEASAGAGDCTLRAAIDESNQDSSNVDTVSFDAGLGTISPGSVLSITGPITIDGNGSGPGAGNTIVDGGDLWQLFSVASTATTATFTDLRLQNAFLDTRSGGGGAALRTDAGATLLDGVVVTENAIDGLGDGRGAGVFAGNSTGTLSVEDSVISDNEITSDGNNNGAGISSDAALTITTTTVSGNDILDGTSAQGGGVLANAGFSLLRSTLASNTAVVQGATGGAVGEGGALFGGANPGIRTIASSTISGNAAADSGGGIELNGDASITGVTFLGNSGATIGQDLYSDGGMATAKNSIFGSAGACGEGNGTIVTKPPGTNIDVGTTCGFKGSQNQVNTIPVLGPLADNGGQTLTHAPLAGSPAIDMTSGCNGLVLDQRSITRPQGTRCDVGAVEVQYRQLTATKSGSGAGTISSAPTGISCGGDCTESYLPGASVTLTATPSPGSVLGSWNGCDSSSGDQCTVALGSFASGSDRMVSASFELEPPAPPPPNPPVVTPPKKKKKKKCKKGQKLKKGKCVKKKRKKP